MRVSGVLLVLFVWGILQAEDNPCMKAADLSEKSHWRTNQDGKLEEIKEPEKKEEKQAESSLKEVKSPHTFKSNLSLVSDYRFRGLSQTMRRPTIQGGVDYSHESGFYMGTWASNVDGTTHYYNNASMEWDFYGGYKSLLLLCKVPDLTYNIGFIYYYYPGGKSHAQRSVSYNTGELYIELAYKGASIKYWQTVTNYFGFDSDNPPFNWEKNRSVRPNGNSRGSIYVEGNMTFNLYEKLCLGWLKGGKLTLLLHIGHQTIRHYEQLSCTDWRATLTQAFDWFNLFVTYVGTNGKKAYYDIPDNSFRLKFRNIAGQGAIVGISRVF